MGLSWVTWEADFTPAREVGRRLARSAWGYGYANEAAVAALSRGFQDVDSVISFTAAANAVPSGHGAHRSAPRGRFRHPQMADRHPLRRAATVIVNRDRQAPQIVSQSPVREGKHPLRSAPERLRI